MREVCSEIYRIPSRRAREGVQTAQLHGVSWQRCWTHFMRNALGKVGHKHKDALAVHDLPSEHRCRVYTTNMMGA